MSVLKTYGTDIYGEKPWRTYKLKDNRIVGYADGTEAVAQAAELLLSTERYRHIIYSDDYGVELEELIGARRELIAGDIERRIREALSEDDRIEGITDFSLSFERESAVVSFFVHTKYGDFEMERSVPILG